MVFKKIKIPQSLDECYKRDPISECLWAWSKQLDSWGNKVLVFLLIAGVIVTIAEGVQIANMYGEDLITFMTVMTSIFKWGMYSFIEYCVYNALSLLLGALATIVQSTKITADVTLYNAAKAEESMNGEEPSVE